MSEVTLTVPEEFVEHFRDGVLHEIRVDGDIRRYDHDDVVGPGALITHLSQDLGVLRQVPANDAGRGELTASPEALAHAAEAMAREVLGPKLVDALACGPIDEKYAPQVLELTAALSWAVERAAELHAAGWVEFKARMEASSEGVA